jgi:hypothetical protein
MGNKWQTHLEDFRNKNKDMDAKDIMKEAGKTYRRGGGVSGYTEKSLASLAGKVGGRVSAYEGSNLASTAARVGGRKSRRRNRSRARRTRRS